MARASNINHEILVWARETAGLSVDEAAKKIGLSSTQKSSAGEKLAELEAGEKYPTRTQLLKIASVYRRPLISFYLNQPPRLGDRGEDFRRMREPAAERDNALLDALVRNVRARQQMVRAILQDDEETRPLDFVGSARIEAGPDTVVQAVRDATGIQSETQRRQPDSSALFSYLRETVESIGVFVVLMGDLGSHHSAISEEQFRGFAIADEFAPFIVINDQDARSARSFTLIHELVHIFLGATGISGSAQAEYELEGDAQIEKFCNEVAGELLLPTEAIRDIQLDDDLSNDEILDVAEAVSRNWKVSQAMVSYRFLRQGLINLETWRALDQELGRLWRERRQRRREIAREGDGGPSYYVVKRSKLGPALVSLVKRTLSENAITHTKAAKVLGVNPNAVGTLLRTGN